MGRNDWPDATRLILLLLVGFFLFSTVPGCSGCNKGSQTGKQGEEDSGESDESEKDAEQEEQPPFENPITKLLPNSELDERNPNAVKQGHWVSVLQTWQANLNDERGEIEAYCVDQTGRVRQLDQSNANLRFVRPVAMPKAIPKRLDLLFYVPRPLDPQKRRARFRTRLVAKTGGVLKYQAPDDFAVGMPPHQYFFVVLAEQPDSYGYVQNLSTIKTPRSVDWFVTKDSDYLVVAPESDTVIPLPSHPLTWTQTAVLLWDGFDPSRLSLRQQQSLVDWLHWGGQLIVSGPNSLERLKGGFLEPYLPALPGKMTTVLPEAIDELNRSWNVPWSDGTKPANFELVPNGSNWPEVVSLEKHQASQFVPNTGRLVVERRIGRGRIAATSFALTDRKFINWDGFDTFFNACVIRRPPREFSSGEFDSVVTNWTDRRHAQREARLVSNVRYFSRDVSASVAEPGREKVGLRTSGQNTAFDLVGFLSDKDSGVAGWNDFSPVADAARQSLREASGISVPSASFIIQVLAVYLIVLVPLNWCVFKVIGRVELAWVAAPIIAIVGAFAVIRVAQLDIGFVRARTELAVVEFQGDYHRSHVTRFTGVYSSLSTSYTTTFEDESALAQPFPLDPTQLVDKPPRTIEFRRDRFVNMSGLQVVSSSTETIHSEQMLSTDGGLVLSGQTSGAFRISNGTPLHLRGIGIVRRTRRGNLQLALLDELESHASAPVKFNGARDFSTLWALWDQNDATAADVTEGRLGIRRLLEMAAYDRRLGNDDVRLIAWSDQEVPGMTITPRASQRVFRTVVVANLREGLPGVPERDHNSFGQFMAKRPAAAEPEVDVGRTEPGN